MCTSHSPLQVAWVLFLEPASDSLGPGIHLWPIGSESLIEWWRRRVGRSRYQKVYIIAHTNKQIEELDHCDLGETVVWKSSFSTMSRSLAELVSEKSILHAVLVTLGTALGAVEALDRVIERHLAEANELSWTAGLPVGAGAWVMSAELLRRFSSLQISWLPKHPGLACQRLRAAVANQEIQEMPFPIQERAIDIAAQFDLNPIELPLSISLTKPEELDIAREVLFKDEDPSRLEALVQWRAVQIRKNDEIVRPHNSSLTRISEHSVSVRPNIPKVLYFSNRVGYSGAEESFAQLIQKIDPLRFEISAILGFTGRLQHELERCGPVRIAPTGADTTYKSYISVRKLLYELRPQIIHLNGAEGLPILWNAIEMQIPIVLHVRNGDMRSYKEHAESAAAIITVSRYLRDRVLRFAVNEQRVHVVYDEADTTWFYPGVYDREQTRRKYNISPDAQLIAMIARFVPNKRHDIMLEAFGKIRRSGRTATLLLKGDSYMQDGSYDKVKRQIETSGFGEHIVHLPWVEDIREIYALADVLVLCSDREGLGRCVVEAMAMEVPVIVTDSGGSHEIVQHGITGMVVPGGNTSALSDAVLRVLENRECSLSMGRAARRSIQTTLDSTLSARKVMETYDGVLAEWRP
jgi:glycosyltransferase involved in cell wall biosynthesis